MIKRIIISALCAALAVPAWAGPTGGPATFPPYVPPTTAQTAAALAIPAPYLGQVATGSKIPQGWTGAVAQQSMSRSLHIASVNLTSFKLVYANWYAYRQTSDLLLSGTTTTTATIEYPVGTFTRVKFSGTNSGTINGSGFLVSDAINVSIPRNATFFVRTWQSNPTGGIVYAQGSNTGTYGQGFVFGTTTTDLTAGGAIVGNPSIINTPVAIIGSTSSPSGCLIGDSRAAGYQDTANDNTSFTGELERSVGPAYAFINMGVTNDYSGVWNIPANVQYRSQLIQYCSFGIDEYGINEIHVTGPSTVAGYRAVIATYFAGKKIYGTTIMPQASSTDTYKTLANQTVDSQLANIRTFNNLVIEGIAGETGYIDIASVIDPAGSGKWPVNGTANYYTGDGNHENTPLSVLIQKSNVINTSWFQR